MSDQVVCIYDFPHPSSRGYTGDRPVKDEVYTISGVRMDRRGKVFYYFRELRTYGRDGGRVRYFAEGFRPIHKPKTNIEIFREIDRKVFSKDKVDA